jgi:hypothetical protein
MVRRSWLGHPICGALVWLIAAAMCAVAAPGQAQAVDPTAKQALTEAANALGMVRGLNRSLEVVNMFEYTASGTMADASGGEAKVERITAGYDYVIPASRVDIERTGPDGRTAREIEVAAGPLAWEESTPGVYLAPGRSPAAERLRPIWLLPHGVILAGARALDKVRVAQRGGLRELTVTLADGTQARALLDAKNFVTHVEMNVSGRLLSAQYADYKDFQDYGVMFPSRIMHKVDGRTIADLTVSEALANPYLIFPPPKELRGPSP